MITPKQRSLEDTIGNLQSRVRRLEVNRSPLSGVGPFCAVAQYAGDYSGVGSTNSWTPDFAALGVGFGPDGIGLTPHTDGLVVPTGWFWVANLQLSLNVDGMPPTGEVIQWSFTSMNDQTQDIKFDTMLPGGMTIGTNTWGASGDNPLIPADLITVGAGGFATYFGTTFTPGTLKINVYGLQKFDCFLAFLID